MYTRIATAVGQSAPPHNMGRKSKPANGHTGEINKGKKLEDKAEDKVEDKAEDKVEDKAEDKSEERSYVCCLSCCFCDTASFERADLAAYRGHLAAEHGVTRNMEALLTLTSQLQAGNYSAQG